MFNLKTVVISVSTVLTLVMTRVAVSGDFSGQWCWNEDSNISAFSIVINKVSGIYNGGYGSVVQSGNKIDENDMAFSFRINEKNIIKTTFKAGISGNLGMIQLKLLDDKRMEWVVLREPKGEIYVPQKAMLHRCK